VKKGKIRGVMPSKGGKGGKGKGEIEGEETEDKRRRKVVEKKKKKKLP